MKPLILFLTLLPIAWGVAYCAALITFQLNQ